MTSLAADSVCSYSREWWATPGLPTGICSPFGAWLLLAQLSSLPAGSQLANVLHASEARDLADRLLNNPHPALKGALAMWANSSDLNDLGREYLAGLSVFVDLGPVPDQASADQWASFRTHGMIPTFPVQIDPRTSILFASALATDISWDEPYDIVNAEYLGGPFGAQVSQCLARSGRTGLFDTRAAGRIAATLGTSTTGLRVISVIADESIAPADVYAAAQEILALGDDWSSSIALNSLPLGDGHAWTLTERESGSRNRTKVYLPAWTASVSAADISCAPGMSDGNEAMGSLLAAAQGGSAAQSAFAEYTSTGFKAAAVTAMLRARALPPRGKTYELNVRFNRPYMVVAETTSRGMLEAVPIADPIWDGIPVFSAWITTPMEAR